MRALAERLIQSLRAEQLRLADQRDEPGAIQAISLFPGVRAGARIGDFNAQQRGHLGALLATLFSDDGVARAEKIFNQAQPAGDYFFARFSGAKRDSRLAWRVEGHHFSATAFVGNDNTIRLGTMLLGGNPADIWVDYRGLARGVYASLDAEQTKLALAANPPRRTGFKPFADPLPDSGLPIDRMTDVQQAKVRRLLDAYWALFQPAATDSARRAFDRAGGMKRLRIVYTGDPAASDGEFYCGLTGAGQHFEFDCRQGHVHMLLHLGSDAEREKPAITTRQAAANRLAN
jgi:hypothetical protein